MQPALAPCVHFSCKLQSLYCAGGEVAEKQEELGKGKQQIIVSA